MVLIVNYCAMIRNIHERLHSIAVCASQLRNSDTPLVQFGFFPGVSYLQYINTRPIFHLISGRGEGADRDMNHYSFRESQCRPGRWNRSSHLVTLNVLCLPTLRRAQQILCDISLLLDPIHAHALEPGPSSILHRWVTNKCLQSGTNSPHPPSDGTCSLTPAVIYTMGPYINCFMAINLPSPFLHILCTPLRLQSVLLRSSSNTPLARFCNPYAEGTSTQEVRFPAQGNLYALGLMQLVPKNSTVSAAGKAAAEAS